MKADGVDAEMAVDYVMGQLDAAAVARFERALVESAALRAEVDGLRAALYAAYGADTVEEGVPPLHFAGVRRRLAAGAGGSKVDEVGGLRGMRWAWIWAAAAVVMGAVNLMLLRMPAGEAVEVASAVEETAAAGAGAREGFAGMTRAQLVAAIERLDGALRMAEDDAAEREALIWELREAQAVLSERTAQWQQAHNRLAARFAPFFGGGKEGLSRFTVIELADAGRVAGSAGPRGFTELADAFLTGAGTLVSGDSMAQVGPVAAAGVEIEGGYAGTEALPIELGESGRAVADGILEGAAMGFTVWRDDEQRGFLEVYNLPSVGEGQQAVLWARASAAEPYLRVGVLPEMDGGTGSAYYSVDEANFTPSELLITAEVVGTEAAVPGEVVLLSGP